MGVEDTTLEDDPIAALDVVESESEDGEPRGRTAVDGRKTGLAPGEEVLPLPERLLHGSEFPVPASFAGDFGSSPGLGETITEATAPATPEILLNQALAEEVRAGLMGLGEEA